LTSTLTQAAESEQVPARAEDDGSGHALAVLVRSGRV
jgi:hypothetical protein